MSRSECFAGAELIEAEVLAVSSHFGEFELVRWGFASGSTRCSLHSEGVRELRRRSTGPKNQKCRLPWSFLDMRVVKLL